MSKMADSGIEEQMRQEREAITVCQGCGEHSVKDTENYCSHCGHHQNCCRGEGCECAK